MGNTIRSPFSILKLIESQMRGADPRDAKQERGLTELIRERCPISSTRAGCPLPTPALLRDLQLTTGGISGANLAGVSHNPLERLANAARPALVLERAGVETVEIDDGQSALIPRWRGDGGGWITEGQNLAAAPLTLTSVTAAAKHCGSHVTYSRRLNKSTDGDLQTAIVAEMRRNVTQQLEAGLLNGTGSNGQPLGLIQQATDTVTFAGSTPTYVEMTALVEALADADGDVGSATWLMNPSTAVALARTEKTATTGEFVLEVLAPRQWGCVGLPMITSTAVPESKVVLIDPRAAQVCYFGPPQLIVDPFSGSNSIVGDTTVIVSNYVDLAVAEPALVVVGNG